MTVDSTTKTAVHSAIAAGRCCEDREKLLNGDYAAPTGAMSFVFKPGSTTIGGHGEVYTRFKETGVLSGFPGEGTKCAILSDANYNEAALKVMEYHDTFKGLKNDVDKSTWILCFHLFTCNKFLSHVSGQSNKMRNIFFLYRQVFQTRHWQGAEGAKRKERWIVFIGYCSW